jgi:hypothetical protein
MPKPTDKEILDQLRQGAPAVAAAAEGDLARRQKQALAFIDKAIQPINREIIRKAIPGLNRDKYIEFAAVVAELRADYLAAALAYFVEQRRGGADDAGAIQALKAKREAYEEALAAYEALHRALERGYVDPVEG